MAAGTYQLSLVFHNTAVRLAWQGAGAPSLPFPSPSLPCPALPGGRGASGKKGPHKIGKVNLGLSQEKEGEVGA